MNLFKDCVSAIKKRPFILSFFIVIALVWSYLDQLVYSLYTRYLAPSMAELLSYFNVFAEIEPEKIVAPGALISEEIPGLIAANKVLPTIILVLLSLLALSAIISFIVSGYSHVLNISFTDKERTSDEFINGVIKHYFKYFVYIFIHIISTIVLLFVLLLASLPSIFSLKLIFQAGYSELILSTIFIIVISVAAILFLAIIYLMYTTYIYPALASYKKGALYMSRKMVSINFTTILPKYLLFMLLIILWTVFLLIFNFGILTFPSTIAVFILNAIFKFTVLFLFVFYVYHTFKKFKDGLQNNS